MSAPSRHGWRWFLPETPDTLGILREQTAVTVEGFAEFVTWAGGDGAAADRVRDAEHRADTAARDLREALTVAFTTPLDPEDLYTLSRGLDEVLNGAKNTVREAEVMGAEPDSSIAAMAGELGAGVQHLDDAFAALDEGDRGAATDAADQAVKTQRNLEHVYRTAMSALIGLDDLHEVATRRELYRRLSRTSDALVGVAERVWYAVLKES